MDEEDLPSEGSARKKSPERLAAEDRFRQFYEELMHPKGPLGRSREQTLQDALYLLLRKLNQGWAQRKANAYRPIFPSVDWELALDIGCAAAHMKLLSDYEAGTYIPHAQAHYLRVAQNKSIDQYFRREFGRIYKDGETGQWRVAEASEKGRRSGKLPPYQLSLEGMLTDSDGVYRQDRSLCVSCDPFGSLRRPLWKRNDICQRIALAYLKCLLGYEDAPQKPLALMYGSILFQLAAEMDSNDPLAEMAKNSKVVTSTKWAHLKMGDANLRELGRESEDVVSRYYGMDLRWGPGFDRNMLEKPEPGSPQRWEDIIYTQAYSRKETSDWIESLGSSMTKKTARLVYDSPELRSYVLDTFAPRNRLREALEKRRKDACK